MADQATGIFSSDQDNHPKSTEASSSTVDPGNPLAILVGEGRKYRTVEDLAKAYIHIDGFVETLKGENAQLRAELAKAKTLDEVLERLKAPEPSAHDQGGKKGDGEAPSGLSAADVAKIVDEHLTGRETARTRQANLMKADAEMRKLFGDKAKEVFEREASTPELKESLIQLASIAPDKFVALFAPRTEEKGGQVDSTTRVNTTAMQSQGASGRSADPGCREYYNELRKKNPAAYYSQSIQLQMVKAAEANPNKFFGRS